MVVILVTARVATRPGEVVVHRAGPLISCVAQGYGADINVGTITPRHDENGHRQSFAIGPFRPFESLSGSPFFVFLKPCRFAVTVLASLAWRLGSGRGLSASNGCIIAYAATK
jgi:hypothetical protein